MEYCYKRYICAIIRVPALRFGLASSGEHFSMKAFPGSIILVIWALMLMSVEAASGQAIFSNPITGTNPNTSNPYTTGQVVNASITVSGIGRGSGITGSNATNEYSAIGWNSSSLDANDYFEFILTPNNCHSINFLSFTYTSTISGGAPSFAFRSSIDNYSSNIGTPNKDGTTISLTGASYQGISAPIRFRLYCWGIGNASRNFRIRDFSFNGTVSSSSPAFTTQPLSATYCQNSSPLPLTIAANSNGGSITTYRWYSNTLNSNSGGTLISGANWLNYFPPGNTPGTVYYYCEVLNSLGCSAVSNPAAITITTNPAGNFSYSSAGFCNSISSPREVASSNLVGAAGTFSSTSGLSINPATGAINPSLSTPSSTSYTVTYTVPASGGCSAYSTSTSVKIDAQGTGTIAYPSSTLCRSQTSAVAPVITGASGTGSSTWVLGSPGGLAMPGNGAITPSTSLAGNYTVTYYRSASGYCPEYSTSTNITISNGGGSITSTTPASRCGAGSVTLGASASSGSVKWYANSSGGTALATGNSFTTPLLSSTTIYYVEADNACGTSSRTAVTATINTIPSIISSSPASRHGAGSVGLGAAASAGTILWYSAATGGASIGSGNAFTTPSISASTTYYAEAVISSCTTASRTAILASINNASAVQGFGQTIFSNPITGTNPSASNPYTTGQITDPNITASGIELKNGAKAESSNNSFGTIGWQSSSINQGHYMEFSMTPKSCHKINLSGFVFNARISDGSADLAIRSSVNGYSSNIGTVNTTGGIIDLSASAYQNLTSTITFRIYCWNANNNNTILHIEDFAFYGTVSGNPVSIAGFTPASRCGSGTVTLGASASAGTVLWYKDASGGSSIGTGTSFTTPSILATTTYFAEASFNGCTSVSRTAITATVNGVPVIASQSTAGASYSQNVQANALSINANGGNGTLSGYQWYQNTTSSNNGGTEITGATASSYIPPTSIAGTSYYYCIVSNSNGCSTRSAVSGAIITLTSPVINGVSPILPLISGQSENTGYRGQRITISGSNFTTTSTVRFNGVAATSVVYINPGTLTAVVNNTGATASGTLVVTNPGTGAQGSAPFVFLGYISNIAGDWKTGSTWLGASVPVSGADATIAHANLITTSITTPIHKLNILSSGTLTFSLGTSSISASEVNNYGSLIWLGSGTLSIAEQMNLSENAILDPGSGTIKYTKKGNQVLFTGKKSLNYNHLILEGAGEKFLEKGTDLNVNNLSISEGVVFNLSQWNHRISILGNITLDGNLESGNCIFEFNGQKDQELTVTKTDTVSLSCVIVNKRTGTLILKNSVQLRDSLVMMVGNVITKTNQLEVGTDVKNPGIISYREGHISGKLRRWYSSSTNSGPRSGLFPIGQVVLGVWRNRHVQLDYTVAPSEGGPLTVEYMETPMVGANIGTQTFIDPDNTGGAGFTITSFSHEGYWKIDNEPKKLTDGEYTISLSGEGYLLPAGLTELTMVKRVNGGDWFCPGKHLPVAGSIEFPVISRYGVSGFSNFGYAGGSSNALPVSLISFDADCEGSAIKLDWSTASETNNHQFIIEESTDGENWNVINTTEGSGNSTTIKKYSAVTMIPAAGEGYYRLTQVDYNGESETFDPVFVSCDSKQANELKIYPNPASEWVNVEMIMGEPVDVQLALFSSSGQILMLQKTNLTSGVNLIRLDISGIPQGAYHLNISSAKNLEITGGRSIIKR
jgi:hypothetical protein